MGWWLPIWTVMTALGQPGVLLAPAPEELVQAERELEKRVLEAEAIGRASSRLQNATFYEEDPCAKDLVVRARAFGTAWRDAAQRARVQAERTTLIALAETLRPLVDDARRDRIENFGARAALQARSWLEFDRLDARSRVKCTGGLRPAAGLPDPTPRAKGEDTVPVAIWVLEGTLCPAGRDMRGVAVVSGAVCVDLDPACGCEPVPVMPGDVLGP